jgi:hypothetical protein
LNKQQIKAKISQVRGTGSSSGYLKRPNPKLPQHFFFEAKFALRLMERVTRMFY